MSENRSSARASAPTYAPHPDAYAAAPPPFAPLALNAAAAAATAPRPGATLREQFAADYRRLLPHFAPRDDADIVVLSFFGFARAPGGGAPAPPPAGASNAEVHRWIDATRARVGEARVREVLALCQWTFDAPRVRK